MGLGIQEGPESQGRYAGEGYGLGAQGDFGDENYDPADQRGDAVPPATFDEDVVSATLHGMPVEHVGSGRGLAGGSLASTPQLGTTSPAGVPRIGVGPRPDEKICEEIRETIADWDIADPLDVDVSVQHGIVVLAGVVDDVAARDAAETSVRGVEGVQGVENRLALREDPA